MEEYEWRRPCIARELDGLQAPSVDRDVEVDASAQRADSGAAPRYVRIARAQASL